MSSGIRVAQSLDLRLFNIHPQFLVGFVLLDLYFYMYVLLIVVCPFVFFLLAIVLSVLRFTDSDYPFGNFKLFLLCRVHRCLWSRSTIFQLYSNCQT